MPPRILIVGGQERFVAGMVDFLGRKGFSPERAEVGPALLARIAAAPPDLAIVDLPTAILPNVLRRLRETAAGRKLPLLLLGGADRPDIAAVAAAFNPRHILDKPLRAEDLLRAIGRALPSPTAGQPLAMHLQRAFARQFCGAYRFGSGEEAPCLWFLHGLPAALRPGFSHRDFADYLRRRGLLSAEEESWLRTEGGRPELLAQIGCLPFRQVWSEHLDYLRAELLAAFPRPPLTVREESWVCPADLLLPAVNLPALIHEGFRRHADPDDTRQILTLHGGRFLGRGRHFFRLLNFLDLRGEEAELLQRIDGTRTLHDCLEGRADLVPLLRTLQLLEMARLGEAPLPAAEADFPLRRWFHAIGEAPSGLGEEALESFADLVEPGGEGIDFTPPPAAAAVAESAALAATVRETRAALQGKNHYEIFGLTRENFSFERLRDGYFRLTRQFGPETLMRLSGAEATMAEEILGAVSSAYNTLSDVVKKERYDELLGSEKIGLGRPGDERFHAQVQFQSGLVFLGMEEWESAEQAFRDASTVDPKNGLYLAHLAWAMYCHPAHAGSLAIREKARQTVHRALALERTAEGFAFKGRMLLDAGQEALAETEFSKACKLNPRLTLARAGLREIRERREQEKKGLFRKLFG